MLRLKALRQSRKLSQKGLAMQLGMSQQNICKYENGICEPDIRTLLLISRFFHVSIDYLIGSTDSADLVSGDEGLSDSDNFSLSQLRKLNPSDRKSVDHIIDSLSSNEFTVTHEEKDLIISYRKLDRCKKCIVISHISNLLMNAS